MKDLFIRHDRLSGDQVEKLKKRIDVNSAKLEAVKLAAKPDWEMEADKLSGLVEKDKVTVAASLHRRVFIRAWYGPVFLAILSHR